MPPIGNTTTDGRPRCRCCNRTLWDPRSVAVGVGPGCLRRMDPPNRGALVKAAAKATKTVPVQPPLGSAA